MNKFAWSSDGNYFVGSFDSLEEAMADALSGLKGEYEFTVGELVPAIEYLSYKKIGRNILEEILDQLVSHTAPVASAGRGAISPAPLSVSGKPNAPD